MTQSEEQEQFIAKKWADALKALNECVLDTLEHLKLDPITIT